MKPRRRRRSGTVRRARSFTACLRVRDAIGVYVDCPQAAEALMDCWHALRSRPDAADRALTVGYGILAAYRLAREARP